MNKGFARTRSYSLIGTLIIRGFTVHTYIHTDIQKNTQTDVYSYIETDRQTYTHTV